MSAKPKKICPRWQVIVTMVVKYIPSHSIPPLFSFGPQLLSCLTADIRRRLGNIRPPCQTPANLDAIHYVLNLMTIDAEAAQLTKVPNNAPRRRQGPIGFC